MLSTTYPPRHANGIVGLLLRFTLLLAVALTFFLPAGAQTISTLVTPLQLPTSIAFDAQGDLYIAETNSHLIRRLDTTGVLTTVAGNGAQGFSGDGGPALGATLDSPLGVAVDGANNLYIADSHNHRVRKVDGITGVISTIAGNGKPSFSGDGGPANLANLNLPSALALDSGGDIYIADTNNHRIRQIATSGLITTVAGDGVQQFSGDGSFATAASIDSPNGVVVDHVGNIYIADTHNQRVRIVNRATGLISTVAGTGASDFTGDNGDAAKAALALPRGVSVDAAGNVYVADSNNQRIRRISVEGTITTVIGDGTQMLSGDGGLATVSGIDTPRSTALSPGGLMTLADTGNGRIRQVNSGGTTISSPTTLTIMLPSTFVYGTGSLVAMLTGGPATGSVSFFDSMDSGTQKLGTVVLAGDIATLSAAGLPAGTHRLFSSYSGDATHASSQSATSIVFVSAAQLTASVASASILYGQPVAALEGFLSGILAQDEGKVSLILSTTASNLSPVGTYPIVGALGGVAASNYALAPLSGAALTINKAPSAVTFSASSLGVSAGSPVSLNLHVASATSGTPTGSVMVFDNGVVLATLPLTVGSVGFTSSALAVGAHELTVNYAGDANFMASTAVVQTITVSPIITGDFALTATGSTSQTIASGSAANFTFMVQMQGAALDSPIALAVSSLPVGMTASFSPASLPPGGAITVFNLTIQTSKAAVVSGMDRLRLMKPLAALSILLLPFVFLSRRSWAGVMMLAVLMLAVGCGDRVVSTTNPAAAIMSYAITVSGTATGASGAVLQHTATVTMNVQ